MYYISDEKGCEQRSPGYNIPGFGLGAPDRVEVRCCFVVVGSEDEVIRAARNAQRSEQRNPGCVVPALEMVIQGERQSCIVVVEVVVSRAAKSERKGGEWRMGKKECEQKSSGYGAPGLKAASCEEGRSSFVAGMATRAAKCERRSERKCSKTGNEQTGPAWGTLGSKATGHEDRYCLVLVEEITVRVVGND